MVKLTFLGTGTSQGVPIIGCQCPVCKSADPHDKRFRAAAFVEYEGFQVLIDAAWTTCGRSITSTGKPWRSTARRKC